MEKLHDILFAQADQAYKAFQAPLIPNIIPQSFIGVRTPQLRALARDMFALKGFTRQELDLFLKDVPHKYFEENQLHSFVVSQIKDFDLCIEKVEEFLPFVDNWAVCDQMSPKIFKKNKVSLYPKILEWLESGKTYHQRFGIGMLMAHFLDEDFDPVHMELIGKMCRPHTKNGDENYYLNMMIAWYFATALCKQWEAAFSFIKTGALEKWVHNKAIQKARESFRVTQEHKDLLKQLKK